MRTRFFDLPLRFQIMIPFSVLIVALAVVAVGFGLPLARKAASENVDLKLNNARSLFLLLLDHEASDLQRSAGLLAQKPELAVALAADDRQRLSEVLTEAELGSLDALQVTDAEGATLVGAGGHAPLSPEALARWGLLGSQEQGRAVVPSPAGHMLVVTSPIGTSPGSPEGFVAAGRLLSRLLPALSSAVAAELAIYQDGQLAASTFTGRHGQASELASPPPELPLVSGPVKKGSVVDGRPYATAYERLPLGGDAATVFAVFVPKSQVWPTEMLVAAGVAAALVIPLLLLVLGFAIARAIASRLERVVAVIERVGAGDFHQRVELDSADVVLTGLDRGDEVGRLAQVVNRMAARLQEAETSKAEFLAMASHELRTPLALIHNATELLLDEAVGEGAGTRRELLEIIDGNIGRMNRRVRDLLDLARLEAGHLSLHREPIDLASLVADVAESVRPMLASKEQAFSLALPPNLPPVNADPDRIQQVLLNLLTNASRHTPPRTHITVRALQDGEAVTIEVEDDGPGISPAQMERLLNGRRRPFAKNGGGLGLLIAQRLVALHGGRLWVQSEPGRGSLFAFALPCSAPGEKVKGHEDSTGG